MKCVHLDFHTGPDIPNIGVDFDKAEFTRTLKKAKIDLNLENASIKDIAPTVVNLLGVSPDDEWEGKSLLK